MMGTEWEPRGQRSPFCGTYVPMTATKLGKEFEVGISKILLNFMICVHIFRGEPIILRGEEFLLFFVKYMMTVGLLQYYESWYDLGGCFGLIGFARPSYLAPHGAGIVFPLTCTRSMRWCQGNEVKRTCDSGRVFLVNGPRELGEIVSPLCASLSFLLKQE